MNSFNNDEELYFSENWLQEKLVSYYGEDFIVVKNPGRHNIICFKSFANKVLRTQWKEDFLDFADKKERIIDMAAMYILDDIRTTFYDLSEYPSFSNWYEIEDVITPSLVRFLRGITKTKSDIQQVSNRQICSIGHALISAARPRSFISSLLLDITTYINQNFASKELINILSSLSFSESYKELKKLHDAILSPGKPSFDRSGFVQFVFDNADFNISTLTGHGTFHSYLLIKTKHLPML